MSTSTYTVTLHHLAPQATAAGLAFTDEVLVAVKVEQVRELLYALSEVAAGLTIYEPAAPEIRVKTDRDVFVIRARHRRLCFVGWEQVLRGEVHSVAYILSTITGTAEPVKIAPKEERAPVVASLPVSSKRTEVDAVPRSLKVVVLTVLIIALNATALWLLLRPPANPAPEYVLLPTFESQALLTKVAGEYETGSQEGDRRLVINSDGTLNLAKFGRNRAITDETTRTARGAMANGRAVLVTNDPYIVAIKDADHVVLYGNTYHRHNR